MPHDTQLTNAQTRDIEALIHPYTNAAAHRQVGAHLIERGEGVYVYDERGTQFIEGMAGLWCAGLGFGDAELIDAAKAQLDRLPYYHLFGGRTHEPAIELAEKIKDLYPVPMARVFYCSSGSEANDTQVKLIWYMMNALGKHEKKKIIARKKGYHGVTLVAASLTGLPLNHGSFDLPMDFAKHTTTPHYWREGRDGESEAEFSKRLAQDLEDMILAEGPDTVAAFIAEPVMGAGGVIVPPEGYFEAIGPVLKKYDVLCIADEVICGFGRTGNWFGTETLSVPATSASMAKQLTAAYAPLSAVAVNAEMAGRDRGRVVTPSCSRPRIHLRWPPVGLRRRLRHAGHLSEAKHSGPCQKGCAVFPGKARELSRPPPGRRDARRGSDGRDRGCSSKWRSARLRDTGQGRRPPDEPVARSWRHFPGHW